MNKDRSGRVGRRRRHPLRDRRAMRGVERWRVAFFRPGYGDFLSYRTRMEGRSRLERRKYQLLPAVAASDVAPAPNLSHATRAPLIASPTSDCIEWFRRVPSGPVSSLRAPPSWSQAMHRASVVLGALTP
jgi:hypothetical protein